MFGFGKKKKSENIIPVNDGNAEYEKQEKIRKKEKEEREIRRAEGRKKFYELFDEVVNTSTQEILDFHANFATPSDDLVNFGKNATIKIVHSAGDLEQYRRAELFKQRREKYGTIVTSNMIAQFRNKIHDFDLYVNDYYITGQRLNISSEIAEKMLETSKKIEAADAQMYFLYQRYGRPDDGVVSDKDLRKAAMELFKCEYCIPEKATEEFTSKVNKEKFYIPHEVRFGNFLAIEEGKDPIILAELTSKMFVLVDHMPVVPESKDFQV